jgi:asparagine synthase (glutamine-hydrolysing)
MSLIDRYLEKIKDRIYLVKIKIQNPTVYATIAQVIDQDLTYLRAKSLVELSRSVSKVESSALPGIFIEAGCALGGSSLVIAASKVVERELFVYDVFGKIPPPTNEDGEDAQERYRIIETGRSEGIAGAKYYGYEVELLNKVKNTFSNMGYSPAHHNVDFIQGEFTDTLIVSQPVSFVHIDADWYDSVRICLERLEPFLVSGGVIVVDDYFFWSGCRKAVDEYFSEKRDQYQFSAKEALHIRRR